MNERFWEFMCAALPAFVVLFAFDIVLCVLLAFSIPFIEPGSDTYYIALLSGGLLAFLFVSCVLVIRECRRRE